MKDFITRHVNKILWLAVLLYTVVFSTLSLKKYYNFDYNAFDLAIFNQVFYNSISGRWFDMSFNLHTYLADHFTPIIILLVPIYFWLDRPETLLILQSIVLSLCAWPIYKISYQVSKHKLFSLGLAFMWLLNFMVHSGSLFEWHLLPLAVFFMLWSFYFYQQQNFKGWLLFLMLVLLVREDMSLLILGFSILSILDKRSKKWITSSLMGIVYFFVALAIISHFNDGDNNKFLIYYSWLGGDSLLTILWAWLSHPLQFLFHIISWSNIFNILVIFLSVGLLPLLAPRYLWLLFFPLLQLALTTHGINSLVYTMHYGLVLLPALFIAAIFAVQKIISQDRFIFRNFILNNRRFLLILLAFSLFYLGIFLSPVRSIALEEPNLLLQNNRNLALDKIPAHSSLIVSANLAPQLSNRQYVYPLQYAYLGRGQFYLEKFDFEPVDYILIDSDDMLGVLAYWQSGQKFVRADFKDSVPDNFKKYLQDYQLIWAKDNLLLYQHKKLADNVEVFDLYSIKDKPEQIEKDGLLVASHYQPIADKNYGILSIDYQKKYVLDKNYLIRFYGHNYYFDIPLDYGLWPVADWPTDKLSSFNYYISSDILAYQIFLWQGEAVLGDKLSADLELDMEAVTSKNIIE